LQLGADYETRLSSASSRLAEALKRADGFQASAEEYQAKYKEIAAQLQASKNAKEEAEKDAAAREVLLRRQAEAEALEMCRQLNSVHEVSLETLRSQLQDESTAAATERAAHASALKELDSCRNLNAAALAEKERVITAKQLELSETESQFRSYRERAEEAKIAAESSHALALRTQEAAHAASVEALQATYEMQLRQLRATSQGAIESVGKSQDALTSVRTFLRCFELHFVLLPRNTTYYSIEI
jgi:hypothetical protein